MIIKSLSETSFENLFTAFNTAFSDYERSWTKDEFEKMLYRRGFSPELSYGAFVEEKLVSFTLNGIGVFNDLKTAYDTGTGTLKEYRGKGLATRIFRESIPFLQQAGISQYLLEVLQHNDKAVAMYTGLGFNTSREFNYFIQRTDQVQLASKELPPEYTFREIELMPNQMMGLWDFQPSWQNNFSAICKWLSDFKIIGGFHKSEFIGYGIIEPDSGDIPQLAVHKMYRRKGVGSHLLNELLNLNRAGSIKVINAEINVSHIIDFLVSKNILVTGTQFEMIKSLP